MTNVPIVALVAISLIGGSLGLLGLTQLAQNLPYVAEKLLSMETSNIMISMRDSPLAKLTGLNLESILSKDGRATKVAQALQGLAKLSQAPILAVLQTLGVKSESLWITNQIFIKDATPAVIEALRILPAIFSILEEFAIPLPPIFNFAVGKPPNGTEWNVEIVKAPRVWDDGTTGEDIIVGGIDTGVRYSHSALKENFVGKHGWYDPFLYTKKPSDYQGHGTHTMGTMVGKKGIGIAPGAKWMACKGCLHLNCLQHALLACGQFMLCPSSRGSGTDKKDCEGVPHVINNSWGGGGGENWYDPVIAAWVAAGIKPFFANGNSGPKCETGGSPADNDHVIAVGATDKDDKLSKFSSRGPKVMYTNITDSAGKQNQPNFLPILDLLFSPSKKKITTDIIKPNVCAPGEKVNSADMLTDNAYKILSGTSMASPAACGVAALLLSKNPKLSLKKLKKYMYGTTDKKLNLTADNTDTCGKITPDEYPNHLCGHGRVNAWKAYKLIKKDMKGESDSDEDDKDAKKKKNKKTKKKGDRKKKGTQDGPKNNSSIGVNNTEM